jgi:hypothetical protein
MGITLRSRWHRSGKFASARSPAESPVADELNACGEAWRTRAPGHRVHLVARLTAKPAGADQLGSPAMRRVHTGLQNFRAKDPHRAALAHH